MYSKDKTRQEIHKGETTNPREANQNTLEARDEEETSNTVDPTKTGNNHESIETGKHNQ